MIRDPVFPPCQNACPIHQDIRGYIALVAQGKLDEALALIRETNPLPAITATICAHPCENKCRRSEVDEALSIRGLKRFVVENAANSKGFGVPAAARGKKVAVIGSGPSGLTAAYDLAMMGYQVAVFEREDVVGGAVRIAVPSYRLPTETIQRDIDAIAAVGVEFKTNVELGRNLTLDSLKEDGYEAVLLGLGLPESRSIPIPGIDMKGVLLALPFLKEARNGKSLIEPGVDVIVVGGGNVAMDVARTARRLGAGSVRVVCLESREEMPASPWEIEEAIEEGIEIDYWSKGPKRILGGNGQITGLECKACLSVFDEQKRFNPTYCEEDLTVIEGNVVILSIGQGANISYLKDMGVELNQRGQIIYDPRTLATSRDAVFACGEVVTGPGLAVEAMANGRKAALVIARYLEGAELAQPEPEPVIVGDLLDETKENIKRQERLEVPLLRVEERQNNFTPIELGYTAEMAAKEARRCMSCGAGAVWISGKCSSCLNCVRVCPYGVPVITDFGRIDIRVDQCQACGICYGACPANAIGFNMPGVEDLWSRMKNALQNTKSTKTAPAVLALYCAFDIYDYSGLRRMEEKHPGAALVSIPCLSKIKVADLLKAFEFGADGVLLVGCPSGECAYGQGDVWAEQRVAEAKSLLAEIDLEVERLELRSISGIELHVFDGVLEEFTNKIEILSKA